jgi:hypothetical protein
MSEIDDLNNRDDETLRHWIKGWEEDIKFHEGRITRNRGYIAEHQAELDRRELAAYWTAHPELLRLEVGDRLLVTEEGNLITDYLIGSILVVDNFESLITGGFIGVSHDPDDGTGDIVPVNTVVRMRAAYLEAHESEAK